MDSNDEALGRGFRRKRKLSSSLSFGAKMRQERRAALERQLLMVDNALAAITSFNQPHANTQALPLPTTPSPIIPSPRATPITPAPPTPKRPSSVTSSVEVDPDTPRSRRPKRPKLLYDDEQGSTEPPFYPGCRTLVKTIRDKKQSVYFHEPVNTAIVTDYMTIVKHPMDLSTVSQKLHDRLYSTFEEFDLDMRLIFGNCLLYNRRETPYAQAAIELEQIYTSEMMKLRSRGKLDNVPTPKPKSTPRAPKSASIRKGKSNTPMDAEVTLLKQEVLKLQSKIQSIKGTHLDQKVWDVTDPLAKKKAAKKPKSVSRTQTAILPAGLTMGASDSDSDDDVPMTYDEKCELRDKIHQLPPTKLNRIVEIIRKHMPDLSRNSADPHEIEIDIDLLDNNTLRHLESFVASCLEPKKKPQRAKKKAKPSASTEVSAAPQTHQTPGMTSNGYDNGIATMGHNNDYSDSSDSEGPHIQGSLGQAYPGM